MKNQIWIDYLKRKNNALIILLILSAALRIILFFTIVPIDQQELTSFIYFEGSDAKGYNQMAINLINTFTFTGNQPTFIFNIFPADSVRPPGYPLFLAVIYFLLGISARNVIVVQIVISIFSILLLYKITWKIFKSKKIAFLSALLFSIDIHSIYFTFQLYTETLFIFLLLITIFNFIKTIDNFKISNAIITGIWLGILILIKPIAIMLPLLISILVLIKNNKQILQKIKPALTILIFSALITSTWVVRNKVVYGDYFFSTISSRNFYFFNCLYAERDKTGKTEQQIYQEFNKIAINKGIGKNVTPKNNMKILNELGGKYIKENPVEFIKRHLVGMINMYFSTRHRSILKQAGFNANQTNIKYSNPNINRLFSTGSSTERIFGIYIALYLFMCYILALIGIIGLFKNKSFFILIFLLGIIFYFTFLTGSAGNPRLKLPVLPFYVMLSAYGFITFTKRKMNLIFYKKH